MRNFFVEVLLAFLAVPLGYGIFSILSKFNLAFGLDDIWIGLISFGVAIILVASVGFYALGKLKKEMQKHEYDDE